MKQKFFLTLGLMLLLALPACATPPTPPIFQTHAVTVGSDGFVHEVIIIVTTNSADVGLILTNGTYIGQSGRSFSANYRTFRIMGTNNADYFGNGDNYVIGDVDSGGYGHIAIGCGPAGVIYLGNSVGDAIFPHDVQAGSFTDGTGTLPQANTIMTNGQPLGTIRPSIVGSDVVANSFTTEGSAGGALDSVVGEASGNDSFQGHIMLSSFYGTYSGMTPLPSGFTGTVTNLASVPFQIVVTTNYGIVVSGAGTNTANGYYQQISSSLYSNGVSGATDTYIYVGGVHYLWKISLPDGTGYGQSNYGYSVNYNNYISVNGAPTPYPTVVFANIYITNIVALADTFHCNLTTYTNGIVKTNVFQ